MLYFLLVADLILVAVCLIMWLIKQFYKRKSNFSKAVIKAVNKKSNYTTSTNSTAPDGVIIKPDNKKIEEDEQKEQQEKWYGK